MILATILLFVLFVLAISVNWSRVVDDLFRRKR